MKSIDGVGLVVAMEHGFEEVDQCSGSLGLWSTPFSVKTKAELLNGFNGFDGLIKIFREEWFLMVLMV